MVRKRKSKAAVERHDPLPRRDGPKLKYFGHGGEQFELVGLLSSRNPGRHGHVFEAVLDSQHYALKVVSISSPLGTALMEYPCRSVDVRIHQFNFYDVAEAAGLADLNIPEQMIVDHMDPFYAECRAYGRMEEKKCNGVVAVRCHGFTSVPAAREREISEAFDIVDWNRPSDEYDRLISERQPLRAIVKDLRREEICFTKTMVRRMKADLFKLRNILVFVRDIRSDNYLGGKLLDFSMDGTAPDVID